jgi:hypothetical protein
LRDFGPIRPAGRRIGQNPSGKKGISMNSRITFAVALTMLSTAALAQTAEEQQACMDDAFRVCSATIPDRARTTACMIQNKSQLSTACQMVMAKYAPGPTAPVQAATPAPIRTAAPVKTASNAARPGKPLNILPR